MRLHSVISFETGRYPPKVARRLRVFNLACWVAALLWLGFAVAYAGDAELRTVVTIDVLMAGALSVLPLLHRIGPRAAPITFMAVSYPATFVICSILGTDSGIQAHYLGYAACAVLLLGLDILFVTINGLIALAFIVGLEIFAPPDGGLLGDAAMLASFIASTVGTGAIVVAVVTYAVREAALAEAAAEFEHQRSESLLTNILPAPVASRLKMTHAQPIADRYDEASILFADMAGFTAGAGDIEPAALVRFLNGVFTEFDGLVEKHGLEKIKTTGDSYMVVSGVPTPRPDHAAALADLALGMLDLIGRMRDPSGHPVAFRIGIATGPVVAGVVGTRKFFYDVWGDAVNVASRMESTGIPGKVQVSEEAYDRLRPEFCLEARGLVEIKGKGPMPSWFLLGRRAELS